MPASPPGRRGMSTLRKEEAREPVDFGDAAGTGREAERTGTGGGI